MKRAQTGAHLQYWGCADKEVPGLNVTTVILTGGRSSRMGRDKGALPVEGGTLLERGVERWRNVFGGVAVAVGTEERPLPAGVPAQYDLHPGAGPMAGLEAALTALKGDAVFLTAVDMPFGDEGLARLLAGRMGEADVCIIRRTDRRVEPLFALYRRTCLPVVTRSLEEGRRSFVKGLFPFVTVAYVDEGELTGFDLERSLFNANRPEEWEKARTLLKEE